jgi:hypothetical protein
LLKVDPKNRGVVPSLPYTIGLNRPKIEIQKSLANIGQAFFIWFESNIFPPYKLDLISIRKGQRGEVGLADNARDGNSI